MFPLWDDLGCEHRVNGEPAVPKFFQRWHEQGNAQNDEEGELKAGLEELLRLPDQDYERGGGEGIEQVARAAQRPAADDDGHHDGGADGGGLPAGRAGVEPDQWNDDGAAPSARDAGDAQEADENSSNERYVEAADREDVHKPLLFSLSGSRLVESVTLSCARCTFEI